MKSCYHFKWILTALLVLGACKPRSPTEDHAANESAAADSSRVDTLEVLIEALKNQLETNQKMSDVEREELEKKLKDAEAEKAKAEGAPATGTATPTPGATPKPTATPTPTAPKLDGPYNIYYMDTQRSDCMQPFDPNNVADGSIFRAFPCGNSEIQQLTLEVRDNGFFRIIHKMTNKCLTMEGNSAAEGTPPTLRPCKAVADVNEQWKFFDAAADGSIFKLQSRLSNFCLKFGNDGTLFQGSCVNNYTEFRLKKSQ